MTFGSEIRAMATGPVASKFTWYACEHPERPLDENVGFHLFPECHACAVARLAARRRSGSVAADIGAHER